MNIKEKVDAIKPSIERGKRRASAIVAHGQQVVGLGVDTVGAAVAVISHSTKSLVAANKNALIDSEVPVVRRLKNAAGASAEVATKAAEELTATLKDGYQKVAEKTVRIPQMTRKEKAEENKIDRKLRKIRKTNERVAGST